MKIKYVRWMKHCRLNIIRCFGFFWSRDSMELSRKTALSYLWIHNTYAFKRKHRLFNGTLLFIPFKWNIIKKKSRQRIILLSLRHIKTHKYFQHFWFLHWNTIIDGTICGGFHFWDALIPIWMGLKMFNPKDKNSFSFIPTSFFGSPSFWNDFVRLSIPLFFYQASTFWTIDHLPDPINSITIYFVHLIQMRPLNENGQKVVGGN